MSSSAADVYRRLQEGPVGELARNTFGTYFGVGAGFKPQEAGERRDAREIAGYYCDFRHKVPAEAPPAGSWLQLALAGRPSKPPMAVAQAALGYWDRHLDGEDAARERFLALADWLIAHADIDRSGAVWRHDFAVAKYGLAPGWISGLTQSQVISTLLRAHRLTSDDKYLELARAGLLPFTRETADGGVMARLDGARVIEEYPTHEPTAVLNGWIFGLIGLHELRLVEQASEASDIYDESLAGLLELLPRYDAGWWSCYSLGDYRRPDLAKPFYQRLHVVLLEALDLISPDQRLRYAASRWRAQITKRAMARIAVDKLIFRATRSS